MKIAIIGAMEEEVTLLRDKIQHCETIKRGGCEIYTGQIDGCDVALLKSGIGKVAAALGTTLLLELCKPDVVINTGSAGGIDSSLSVGDIVISSHLMTVAQQAVDSLKLHSVRGLICSGDAFINGAEQIATIKAHFPTVIAVEMEATAIAHVCHQFNVPFVVIRAISDVADKESHLSFDEFLAKAAQQSTLMVLKVISLLK